jgi:hypothetical protein
MCAGFVDMAMLMGAPSASTDPEAAAARDAGCWQTAAAGKSPDAENGYPPISAWAHS